MKVKQESEKAGSKLNIQKMKIMASGPITSWQIYGETMETMTDFIFLGFKIFADGDCSHEIKRLLLLGTISLVQLLSCVWLFVTPWTATHQASLSITNSQSLLKLMSIESMMPSNHLCCHFNHMLSRLVIAFLPRSKCLLISWLQSSAVIWEPKKIKSVTISIVSLSIWEVMGLCKKVMGLCKKSYDKTRQHIKKQRHHFANKGPSIKVMIFPAVMYGCESWIIKKA